MTNDNGELKACPKCGSNKTTWHSSVQNNSPINNGMLNLHYVSPIFLRLCDECSEMLEVLSGDAVAAMLTRPDSRDDGLIGDIKFRIACSVKGGDLTLPLDVHRLLKRCLTALPQASEPAKPKAEDGELIKRLQTVLDNELLQSVDGIDLLSIKEAIAEIQRLRSGWMPIETAPKSSKYILLWCPENKMTYECCWREDEDRWCVIGGHLLWQTPTKWRELPQPPQEPK